VDDLEAEPNLDPALRNLTHKSVVSMPLMRGEVALGALALGGRERGGFSDSQMEPPQSGKPRTASWSGCRLRCRATKTRPHLAALRLAQAGWASGRSGRDYRLGPVAILAFGHEQNRLDFGCLDMILARADEIDTPGWNYLRRASVLLNAHAARYDRNLNPT
jgi:hypothetical protein